MTDVNATLAERGNRYGAFKDQAVIAQNLKACMRQGAHWEALWADQKEALEVIANKIGRILNGDPNYADSWHDIAGYAKLVDDRLTSKTVVDTAARAQLVLDERAFLAACKPGSMTDAVRKASRKAR